MNEANGPKPEFEQLHEVGLLTDLARKARQELLYLAHLGPENAQVIEVQGRFCQALQLEEWSMTDIPTGLWISYHTAITFIAMGLPEYAKEAVDGGIDCLDQPEYDAWADRGKWMSRLESLRYNL